MSLNWHRASFAMQLKNCSNISTAWMLIEVKTRSGLVLAPCSGHAPLTLDRLLMPHGDIDPLGTFQNQTGNSAGIWVHLYMQCLLRRDHNVIVEACFCTNNYVSSALDNTSLLARAEHPILTRIELWSPNLISPSRSCMHDLATWNNPFGPGNPKLEERFRFILRKLTTRPSASASRNKFFDCLDCCNRSR
jgi:hypothetical protein